MPTAMLNILGYLSHIFYYPFTSDKTLHSPSLCLFTLYCTYEETGKMGDMEHMTDNARQEAMQEEEEEILAEEDALHPYNLEQKTPWAIFAVFNTVISFLVSYGWFTVGVLVVLAILWRIFNPKIYDWLKRREADKEAAEYHKDPDKFLERERAMDDVRRRMQDRYNLQALEHAEKAAERQKE
ncbi:hypothetical protein SK128_015300, partial [Halocaridina rubra]